MLIMVDAMGGDNAPEDIVNGCVDAVEFDEGFNVLLVGDSKKIEKILKKRKYRKSRISIEHTSEVVLNDDIPTKAIKTKKDSSMVVGLNLLKDKKGDVFLSAGNTGALMTGALFILGRIEGIDRPALAPVIPTKKGRALLIDAGLNTMCKPINYLQFGILGSIYMNKIFALPNPKVGLLNVGSEEQKGNETIKQAFSALSKANINFVGNIEGRELPDGNVDVAVCDGFVGNIILKFMEGVGSFIFDSLNSVYSKNLLSKFSAFTVRGELKKFKKKLDYEEYGGIPILGVNGTVFKCHGSSSAKSIKNAVLRACKFAKSAVLEQIMKEFRTMEVNNAGS